MKNLRNYCIAVSNSNERNIAIDFYRRAMKKSLAENSDNCGRHVGMCCGPLYNKVTCSTGVLPRELELPFSRIGELADTPSRRAILAAVYKKHLPDQDPDAAYRKYNPTQEKKKTPSKLLPIVSFGYPLHGGPVWKYRVVRVVKKTRDEIMGYEIDPMDFDDEGKFKKFKVAKIANQNIHLVQFNS